MDPYTPENRTIDIYARGSGTADFTITSNVTYVKVTPSSGTISYPSGTSDIRATVSVDWSSAPTGSSTATISITPKTGTEVKLTLPLANRAVPAAQVMNEAMALARAIGSMIAVGPLLGIHTSANM